MSEISKYWQNQGVTTKQHGRVFETGSSYLENNGLFFMCDDPTHRNRQSCHACLGTGTNLTADEMNAEKMAHPSNP